MLVKRFGEICLFSVGGAISESMDDHQRVSERAAIVQELAEEVSHAIEIPPKKTGGEGGSGFWHWLGPMLAAILAAAALAGGLGSAFYVDRKEYTGESTRNAVEHERMRQTLDRVARSLDEQTAAIKDLQKTVWSGHAK